MQRCTALLDLLTLVVGTWGNGGGSGNGVMGGGTGTVLMGYWAREEPRKNQGMNQERTKEEPREEPEKNQGRTKGEPRENQRRTETGTRTGTGTRIGNHGPFTLVRGH